MAHTLIFLAQKAFLGLKVFAVARKQQEKFSRTRSAVAKKALGEIVVYIREGLHA